MSTDKLNVEVIKGNQLTPDLKSRWSELQSANEHLASPFFCHEFVSIVSTCRNDIYIAVISDGNEVTGFFPYQKGRFGMAKPFAGAMSDYHGYISKPGDNFVMSDVLDKCGLTRWSFDHLISSQSSYFSQNTVAASSHIIDVSGGYEQYSDEIRMAKSKFIAQTSRKRRGLEREYGEIRIELFSENIENLKICIAGKEQQFINTGLPSPFEQRWIVEMLEKILSYKTDTFAGVLSVLYLGDRAIATHMGMRSEKVWHYWLPTYDHSYSKYSPGQILLLTMIQQANALGFDYIDLGKGDSTYKSRAKNREVIVTEGTCSASSKGNYINGALDKLDYYEKWLEQSPDSNALLRFPGRVLRRLKRDRIFK